MQKTDFEIFVTDLCEYLEHRIPKAETLRAWYGDCSRVPGEALSWIKAQFRELDKFPANLPKWLFLQFRLWLEAHPEKKARTEKAGCDQCHEGWILVSRFDSQVGYRGDVLFRCGHCNGGPGAIPARTIYQLLEGGYCKPYMGIILDYHQPFNELPADEVSFPVWQDRSPLYHPEGLPQIVGDVLGEMRERT